MDKIETTLNAVISLRNSLGEFCEQVLEGVEHESDESSRAKFQHEFQDKYGLITVNLRDVESHINGLQTLPIPINMGNAGYLAQETAIDRQSLYPQQVNSYKWMDKLHDYSYLAFNNLTQNNLRRSYTSVHKRPRIPFSSLNSDPEYIEKLFSDMNQINLAYNVCVPFGTNPVVVVTIGQVFKAAIVFKGVLIEWATIKGLHEAFDLEDVFAESRYETFRKVQDHAHSAMLHFFLPTGLEISVKSYITWLNSYNKLFVEPCKRCNRYLLNGFPPTWRDFRTLEPFHVECKNC